MEAAEGSALTTVIVMTKAPRPGRVKTRLVPPCSPVQAARIAEAALRDTLDVALSIGDARVLVALDGPAPDWLPPPVEVVAQRGATFDVRLQHAFDEVRGPAVLIGMDTPQVTGSLLRSAIEALGHDANDAVLGPAHDGGWWIAGFRRTPKRAFEGVPMSTPFTHSRQRDRFTELGLRTLDLPALRDVDTIEDAIAVAAQSPHGRFAGAVRDALAATAARH